MPKPIKRHHALQPLSRDHHRGLLLCWKIREGLKRNIEIDRIKAYTDWFWESHLQTHFELEEQYIFPIMEESDPNVKQAIDEHVRLENLFRQDHDLTSALRQIETELADHIRFEERILFNEIQRTASESQWQTIEKMHTDSSSCDIWPDRFWE